MFLSLPIHLRMGNEHLVKKSLLTILPVHYGNIFEDNSTVYDTGELFIPLLECTQCIRHRGIPYTLNPCKLEFKINIF